LTFAYWQATTRGEKITKNLKKIQYHWRHPKIFEVGKPSENLDIWPNFLSIFGTEKLFEIFKF
jgi:hypothetical protein